MTKNTETRGLGKQYPPWGPRAGPARPGRQPQDTSAATFLREGVAVSQQPENQAVKKSKMS
jgi:hypothetical protein